MLLDSQASCCVLRFAPRQLDAVKELHGNELIPELMDALLAIQSPTSTINSDLELICAVEHAQARTAPMAFSDTQRYRKADLKRLLPSKLASTYFSDAKAPYPSLLCNLELPPRVLSYDEPTLLPTLAPDESFAIALRDRNPPPFGAMMYESTKGFCLEIPTEWPLVIITQQMVLHPGDSLPANTHY